MKNIYLKKFQSPRSRVKCHIRTIIYGDALFGFPLATVRIHGESDPSLTADWLTGRERLGNQIYFYTCTTTIVPL